MNKFDKLLLGHLFFLFFFSLLYTQARSKKYNQILYRQHAGSVGEGSKEEQFIQSMQHFAKAGMIFLGIVYLLFFISVLQSKSKMKPDKSVEPKPVVGTFL